MLVSAYWLKKNFLKKNIKILDASWYLPNVNRNALNEFKKTRIPGAKFFDIDEICDQLSAFPHMLPNKKFFEKKVSNLGIKFNDVLIIYCREGILSSPRVWWIFKYFGHKKVFILNGGFKAWGLANGKIIGGPVERKITKYKTGRIMYNYSITFNNLINMLREFIPCYVIDGRPERRFLGLDPEPRKNIGSGKIEGSFNLDFTLFDRNGYLKKRSEIRNIYSSVVKKKNKIILSCGSGVSACTLAFALDYIGNNRWSVYDGSWTEWYSRTKN